MKTPDWNDLRYFLALNDAGTLSAAAVILSVEHTTVARRIGALEQALEMRLFDRFPKGWSLTAAGSALLTQARKMEYEMHTLLRVASGATGLKGTVCISAPPVLAAQWLAPRLTNLLRQLPGIEIELRGETKLADLTRRDADIALRFQRPRSQGLAVRLLTTIGYGLYASPTYLAQHASPQWEFLGYGAALASSPQQQWLDQIRGERRTCLRTNDQTALMLAAKAGCGVAVLPHYLVDGVSPGDLTQIADQPCPVTRKLWIVMHEDVRRSRPVRAVADEINALFDPV